VRITRAAAVVLGLSLSVWAGLAPSAAAQDAPADDQPRRIDIAFDVGPYDPALDDFPVNAVVVTGNGYEGLAVTVEIRGRGDALLWTGETTFTPPSVRIPVNPAIAVGRIESAGIVQRVPIVEAAQFVPPEVSHAVEGGAGGSGQLALSMVLIVALVALLFRSPLPSSTAQRWTR
jgi:hypothetical protein